jgi:hypothetical protein
MIPPTATWQTDFDAFGHEAARWRSLPDLDVDSLRQLRVDFGARHRTPLVVSFGTRAYLPAARNLRADCLRLGLECDIAFVDLAPIAATTRQIATRLKRGFIQSMLILHQRPLWWLDVDAHLLARPPEIPAGHWLAVHHQPEKKEFPIRSSVLWIAPGPKAWYFLNLWHARHQQKTEDHTPLVAAWRLVQHDPGIQRLDVRPWFQNDATPVNR